MFPRSFSTLIVFANSARYYSVEVVQREIIKFTSTRASCILNRLCRMFPDIFDCASVARIRVDTYACIRDARGRVRRRMRTPSFQAHPGTPPVGGGVTGNRYPSAFVLLELLLSQSRGKERKSDRVKYLRNEYC